MLRQGRFFVAILSMAVGCSVATCLYAQTEMDYRQYNGTQGFGEELEQRPVATNETRADELFSETFSDPKQRIGKLRPAAFKRLWAQGLKDLVAKSPDGKIVQIREYGADGELHDTDAKSTTDSFEGAITTQSIVITRQLDNGLYLGTFSGESTKLCVFDLPGALLADGDVVSGQFARVGVYRYGTRNLAHYKKAKDSSSTSFDENGGDLLEADIQSVYNAFNAGKLTFIILEPIAMECLTCEGTGREFDEEKIKEEARAEFLSRYNYRSDDRLRQHPKKPLSYFYEEVKKKTFSGKFCQDCRGKKKVPVRVFVKYSAR